MAYSLKTTSKENAGKKKYSAWSRDNPMNIALMKIKKSKNQVKYLENINP